MSAKYGSYRAFAFATGKWGQAVAPWAAATTIMATGLGLGAALPAPSCMCYFETTSGGKVDRVSPWEKKWHEKYNGKPAFHRTEVNEHLVEFYEQLFSEGQKMRVLVPLCGKTIDMPFLAERGHEVIGVEGVERAVVEFRREQNISMQEAHWSDGTAVAAFRAFVATSRKKIAMDLAILVGDFFELKANLIGGQVDVIYDRASLVALPPSSRSEYADVIQETLKVGGHYLLVVVEYDQALKEGPPFSVTKQEVEELYLRRGFTIDQVVRAKIDPPMWSSVPIIYDSAYLLTKVK